MAGCYCWGCCQCWLSSSEMIFECPCGRQETATRVSSCVDVAVLTYPVIRLGLLFHVSCLVPSGCRSVVSQIFHLYFSNLRDSCVLWLCWSVDDNLWFNSGNWEEIREELSVSNVLQRDNVLFAGRLHACLEDVATANEKEVTFLKI